MTTQTWLDTPERNGCWAVWFYWGEPSGGTYPGNARYTDHQDGLTIDGEDYAYAPLDMRFSDETGDAGSPATCAVTTKRGLSPIDEVVRGFAFTEVYLSVWSVNPDDTTELVLEFTGYLEEAVERPNEQDELGRLIAVDWKAALRDVRVGARAHNYCTHARFGNAGCKFNLSSVTYTGTVTAVSSDGLEVTVSLSGSPPTGSKQWQSGKLIVGDRVSQIQSGNGTRLDLLEPMPASIVSSACTAIEGCDRTRSRCVALNNTENFVGLGRRMALANPVTESS